MSQKEQRESSAAVRLRRRGLKLWPAEFIGPMQPEAVEAYSGGGWHKLEFSNSYWTFAAAVDWGIHQKEPAALASITNTWYNPLYDRCSQELRRACERGEILAYRCNLTSGCIEPIPKDDWDKQVWGNLGLFDGRVFFAREDILDFWPAEFIGPVQPEAADVLTSVTTLQTATRSPDKEQKNRGGRPLTINTKMIYIEIIRYVDLHGLPDRDEMMGALNEKLPDQHGSSNLRNIVGKVCGEGEANGLSIEKAIFHEIIQIAISTNGLPKNDDLTAAWLPNAGRTKIMCLLKIKLLKAPESKLRSIVEEVYSSLEVS
jgi:hypothetical protein